MKSPFLAPSPHELNFSPLTASWLGGFTDGDGSFSIINYKPRLKFENHEKEIELLKRIKTFLNTNSRVLITKPRSNKPLTYNPTVCLDVTEILFLKQIIVPLYSNGKFGLLKSKKLKDFNDWSIVVDLYYSGYHLIPEGRLIITEIKNRWNNFRLSTHYTVDTLIKQETLSNSSSLDLLNIGNGSFDLRLKNLYLIPSPYDIKNGIRIIRGTNNLVSESFKIRATDNLKNTFDFSSITECSIALKLDRAKIKTCLLSGEIYKNYRFTRS